MPARDYYESLWEGVPGAVEPIQAGRRTVFLLGEIAALGTRTEGPVRVLDLGCGEGYFAATLAREGAHVVAADVAEEPLRRARARYPELDLRLVEPEAALPFEDSSFDAVWAGETIEHVADTASWLSEVRRVLRSGGSLLLSTPAHGLLSRLVLALRPHAFDSHFDPRSDHLRFYTRHTLGALLADFGFADIAVRATGAMPAAQRVLLARGTRKRF